MTRSVQITASLRRLIWKRDSGWCVRCFKPLLHTPHAIHHRRPRMMGGTTDRRINDPRNLILLCDGCHEFVESNRRAARAYGYLIESLDDEQLDRPIVTLWTHIRLDADGGRHEVRPVQPDPTQDRTGAA